MPRKSAFPHARAAPLRGPSTCESRLRRSPLFVRRIHVTRRQFSVTPREGRHFGSHPTALEALPVAATARTKEVAPRCVTALGCDVCMSCDRGEGVTRASTGPALLHVAHRRAKPATAPGTPLDAPRRSGCALVGTCPCWPRFGTHLRPGQRAVQCHICRFAIRDGLPHSTRAGSAVLTAPRNVYSFTAENANTQTSLTRQSQRGFGEGSRHAPGFFAFSDPRVQPPFRTPWLTTLRRPLSWMLSYCVKRMM